MQQKQKPDSGAKETILLRQAAPRYNFSARKLPKEDHKEPAQNVTDKQTSTSNATPATQRPRPVAVVGASQQTSTTTNQRDKVGQSVTANLDDNDIIRPPLIGETTVWQTSGEHSQGSLSAGSCPTLVTNLSQTNSVAQAGPCGLFPTQDVVQRLEHQRDQLQKDLQVQLEVNSELKRLLVASVGDDLSQRVERLCRDRAQLSLDLGGYSQKMREEYENLDKVSIQADMWRSKYLASRVMIEELGNARAFYALQCHDSHEALQQLLNERHELRANLVDMHRVLQQMKNAFDPLNCQRSSTLKSTNLLDLSRACQQLVEALRFRLLPAHVAISVEGESEETSWVNSVTRAEQFAHEVLSRSTEPPGSLHSGSSRLIPLTSATDSAIARFHPNTRHENLTYNCCVKCKGEINVV